jgi:small-conductance mechanosensitive channel
MESFKIQIIESVIVLVAYGVLYYLNHSLISKVFQSVARIDTGQRKVYKKVVNLFMSIVLVVILSAIWGVDQNKIALFVSSVLTVMGIAFFAQWSILSNITASLILFFNHPLKIGDTIRVLDKEYPFEGEIIDLTYFFVYVKISSTETLTIPNNVLLQKAIIVLDSVGSKH